MFVVTRWMEVGETEIRVVTAMYKEPAAVVRLEEEVSLVGTDVRALSLLSFMVTNVIFILEFLWFPMM